MPMQLVLIRLVVSIVLVPMDMLVMVIFSTLMVMQPVVPAIMSTSVTSQTDLISSITVTIMPLALTPMVHSNVHAISVMKVMVSTVLMLTNVLTQHCVVHLKVTVLLMPNVPILMVPMNALAQKDGKATAWLNVPILMNVLLEQMNATIMPPVQTMTVHTTANASLVLAETEPYVKTLTNVLNHKNDKL